MEMAGPVNVYLSHAPEDKELAVKLAKHLRPQVNEGLIGLEAEGGSVAEERADVILMLISPDYLPSEGAMGQLDRALYLRKRKGTWVVPVLLHSVDLSPIRPPLRPLPHNRVPVTEWAHVNAALSDVAKGVRQVAERITETQAARRWRRADGAPEEPPLIYLCAHEADEGPLRALVRHLTPSEAEGRTRLWSPDRLLPGESADADEERFAAARLIVVLLSADLLSAGDLGERLQKAVERRRRSEAEVVAIRVRPVADLPALLRALPIYPADGRALSAAADPDEAWSDVARQVLGCLDPRAGLPQELADLSAWAVHASIEDLRHELDCPKGSSPLKMPAITDRIALSDTELWATARSDTAHGEHRVGALLELSRRGVPGLPAFVTARIKELLTRPPAGGETAWRDGLLLVLEQTRITDPDMRGRLTEHLLGHGRLLRAAGEEGPLVSALRSLSTLLSGDRAGVLVEFLGDGDTHLLQQAALQAIQTLFSAQPPAADDDLSALRDRVRAVAAHALDAGRVSQVAEASLGVSAVRAAVALDDPAATEVIEAMIALGRPQMLWLCLDPLAQLLDAWERAPGPLSPAVGRLRARLERLRVALSRGAGH